MEIGAKEIRQLRKVELLWLASHRCKHRHTYLSHFHCFLEEQAQSPEKVGFFDIETSNLNANFGLMLSYCIKEKGGKIIGRSITSEELHSRTQDKALVKRCVSDLQGFERIVTFYGARFDMPYIRTRALYHRIRFPGFQSIKHTDVYFWVKSKMKLHSNRMQNACDLMGIPSKRHKMHFGMWTKALTGDSRSLQYILTHNKEDVVSLEKLYNKLIPFATLRNTSI